MATLQVREVPENIYNQIAIRAKAEHRSIAQETVSLLAKGLECELNPRERRRELLEKLCCEGVWSKEISDPAKLIREDRDR
jgi:antitoxin FitA